MSFPFMPEVFRARRVDRDRTKETERVGGGGGGWGGGGGRIGGYKGGGGGD